MTHGEVNAFERDFEGSVPARKITATCSQKDQRKSSRSHASVVSAVSPRRQHFGTLLSMLLDDETAPTLTPREVTAILSETSKIDSANTDRYSAQAVLGQGGMGEVLLAKDTRIGREVAMKMIRTDQCGSSGEIE